MKLNGALKPHHGAPALGRSIGAKKYRDKRYERHCSRMQNKCNINDRFVPVQQEDRQEQEEDEQQQEKHTTKITQRQQPSGNEHCFEEEAVNIFRRRCASNREKTNASEATQIVIEQLEEQQQKVLQKRPLSARTEAAEVVIRDSSKSCSSATKMPLNNMSDEASDTKEQPVAACARLKSFNSVLWPFIGSAGHNLVKGTKATAAKVMRVQQSLVPESIRSTEMNRSAARISATGTAFGVGASFDGQKKERHEHVSAKPAAVPKFMLCLLAAVTLLPHSVVCDEGDNFFAVNSFSVGPETTTPEFDYASRGQKKFGDKCDNTLECGFPGSICDPKKKSCQCTEDLPVTNHIDKCGKEAAVNESCFFNEQCEVKYFQTECRDGRCACRFEMSPIWGKDGSVECKGRQEKRGPGTYIDPAMIGVLVGMALMFVIICVVLRLFSQARWRENRTIFNTPNPRLMNVSLLRDSKLLHGQERRGSRMSVRAPSRQPSMASLRPHSPNPSLGKTGSNSQSGSNASPASVAPGNIVNNQHHERKSSSHHQHQHQPHQHHQQQQHEPLITNITANPGGNESVTVEIIVPEKK